MTEDEERQADEVNIAFQMGAEWQMKRSKARIEQLEAALRKIASCKSYHSGDIVDIARAALEGKKDG